MRPASAGAHQRNRKNSGASCLLWAIFGPFSHLSGHFSPIFQVRPESIFWPFLSPFWTGGLTLICTRSTRIAALNVVCRNIRIATNREEKRATEDSPCPIGSKQLGKNAVTLPLWVISRETIGRDPRLIVGNGRNTVSRLLFQRRELTEPH